MPILLPAGEPGMNTNFTNLKCSLNKPQPAITGVYLDLYPTTDSFYYIYWRSYCELEMEHKMFLYSKDCEQVGSPLKVCSDPISLNTSEIPIIDYLFQIQDSNMASHSALFNLTTEYRGKKS